MKRLFLVRLVDQLTIQEKEALEPLWNQTPEVGVEALIATIEDKAELIRAIKASRKLKLT